MRRVLCLALIAIGIAGCGEGNGSSGTGTTAPAPMVIEVPQPASTSTPMPTPTPTPAPQTSNFVGSIAFSDPLALDNGGPIIDYTNAFSIPGFPGHLGIGGGIELNTTISQLSGQTASFEGITTGGSTITVNIGAAIGSCPAGPNLCSAITGTINVSTIDAAAMGHVQGMVIALTMSGIRIINASTLICDAANQPGSLASCNALSLNFAPH